MIEIISIQPAAGKSPESSPAKKSAPQVLNARINGRQKITPKKASAVKLTPPPQKKPKNHQPKSIKKFLADHFNNSKNLNLNSPNKSAPKVINNEKNTYKINNPTPSPKTQKTSVTSNNSPSQPQKPRSTSQRLWNILQLISTAAVIFAILFIITNWSAYSVIFEKRISDFMGWTDNSQLEKIASDQQIDQNLLPISGDLGGNDQIPPLSLEIAPPDTRIVIPRINENVPIVTVSTRSLIRRDWGALETEIQEALRNGVVHYPGTSLPGENGNVVITGHSSYFPWDPGRFKDVFALLHDLRDGDRIVVYHNQQKYIYEVKGIKIILPEQVDVLNQNDGDKLTLITCTPVGTNLKRLIVTAFPIQS